MWDGKQIVSKDWVAESVTPYVTADDGFKYGFQWWLYPLNGKFVWMGRGCGGQRLMVFPEDKLIVVLTGWEILKEAVPTKDLIDRLLPAIKATSCSETQK